MRCSSVSPCPQKIGSAVASQRVPRYCPRPSWSRPRSGDRRLVFPYSVAQLAPYRPQIAVSLCPCDSEIALLSREKISDCKLHTTAKWVRGPGNGLSCRRIFTLCCWKRSPYPHCRSDLSRSSERTNSDSYHTDSATLASEQAKYLPSLNSLALSFDRSLRDRLLEEAPVQSRQSTMTVTTGISIVDGQLLVQGKSVLTGVPENIVLTAATGLGPVRGAFLGASSLQSKSRHVFQLGVLRDLRFVCCYRFSLWWMTQRMGSCGKDVPLETQFLILESKDGSPLTPEMDLGDGNQTVYTVFLPLLEGSFRSSLQGNDNNELELCLESGDPAVQTNGGLYSIFLNSGTEPFQVISEAVQAMEVHMQTFHHREKKKMPGILDWFGWCTWDAFYTDVTAEGVREGLKSLEEGGTPAGFVIIDDGWQSVGIDQPQVSGEATAGTQFARRLTDIKENYKFQKDGKDGERQEDPALGLQHVVREVKEKHNLKYVYVWHAITGYWGGIMPDVVGMEQYETAMKFPVHSLGVLGNQPNMAIDSLTVNGLGLAHPKKVFQFYNELHSYLAAAGVDGVKVDVQNILETLGAGFGGRVPITRHYHQALEASVANNFPDNGCIACMSHNTDGLYSIKQTAVVRASDDFWPRDPASHTSHIASVAYNSVFLGEFMQPDWDMFHSLHPAAEYHAAARAIGGCPIYVSDKPGHHDFDLLKRLVLADGSILRAKLPGRPTRDCLFADPARDGKTLLKIWNMNTYTGVLGAFNCQGAGWSKVENKYAFHDTAPVTITGSVHARDVDFLGQAAPQGWSGDCAIYTHRGGELVCLPKSAALPVTLKVLEYEVYTVSPIKSLAPGVAFAPIGLLKMFNSGGAIVTLDYQLHETGSEVEFLEKPADVLDTANYQAERTHDVPIAVIRMKVLGCGQFGVYSSVTPRRCLVDSVTTDFFYKMESGLVTLFLPATEGQSQDVIVEV